MDKITKNIQGEVQCSVLFAGDNIMLIEEIMEEVSNMTGRIKKSARR